MADYEADILQVLADRGTVSVRELAALLNVSEQTVRRVVRPLVERGALDKTHGAVIARDRAGEAPFAARMAVNQRAKVAIASAVAELVHDGDSVALDAGSTTGYVAHALRRRKGLTVVTNSALIAGTLATVPGNRVLMAGVELRAHDGAANDAAAFDVVRSMRVRVAVLSASAIDPTHGLMVAEHADGEMVRAMAAIAERRVFAVDSSKFGRQALFTLDRLTPSDVLVTDDDVPARLVRSIGRPAVVVARPAVR